MSDLTERLWYASERVSPSDITMGPPPRGSLKWVEIQCAEAAKLIDAIDAAVSDEWSTDASKIISIYRLLHPEDER